MADEGTMRDHIEDLMEEIKELREEIAMMQLELGLWMTLAKRLYGAETPEDYAKMHEIYRKLIHG